MDKLDWKVMAITSVIIIVILFILLYTQSQKEVYDLGEFEIDKEQLNNIKEEVGNSFLICEIDTGKCTVVK